MRRIVPLHASLQQQHRRQHTIPIEASLGSDPSVLPPSYQFIKCPGCSRFLYRNAISEKLHRQICPMSSNGFSCRGCMLLFLDRQQLVDHQQTCKSFLQKKIQKKNKSENNKKQDITSCDNGSRLICDHKGCGRTFASKKTLRQHKKRHSKPFECRVSGCSKSFGSSWDRTIHERTHSVEKKEKCKLCLSRFNDPSALRRHMKRFHNGCMVSESRPFQCRMCKMPFRTKDDLQTHYKTHSPRQRNPPIPCSKCRKFVSANKMAEHKKRCRTERRGNT